MAHVFRAWRAWRTIRFLVPIAVLGIATQAILSRGSGAAETGANGATRPIKIIGSERLVSVEPLPEAGGEICIPESVASPELIASLQQENLFSSAWEAASPLATSLRQQQSGSNGATSPPRPSDAVKTQVASRQPASTIKDPRSAFAGLAIDPIRNEVVIAEENNFSLLVYDRTENTPPRAASSQPRRVIQGEKTYLEYACSVYIDPETGNIYGINNDTLNWMTVFDRNAKGNASPSRKLHTPHTTFGVVADEENQELLMTVQDDHAVVTFKKNAKDQDAPVRLLQGPKTLMADPHGIALDPKTGLIYVTNWGTNQERRYDVPPRYGKVNWPVGRNNNIPASGKINPPSITVYHKDDKGDVAPLRVIQGPRTGLDWPTSIAVHPDRGELFVANDTSHTITVYRTDANGDAAPIRVLEGSRSGIKNPTGVALDLKNNELWVANFGSHSATVFPVDAEGDPVPKRVIRSAPADQPSPMLSNPHTIAYDSKRDQLLVAN